MKKKKFKEIQKVNLSKIHGGTKRHPTTIGDPKEPQYTDVHIDVDEDGQWTAGDELVITKV